MIIIGLFIAFLLVAIGLYNLLTLMIPLPNRVLAKTYKREKKKKQFNERLLKIITAYLPMNKRRINQLAHELRRAGIVVDPNMYMASIYFNTIAGLICTVLTFLFVSPFIGLGVLILTIGLYQQKVEFLVKRRHARIEAIEIELPFFVRTFRSQLKYSQDVAKILKSYIDRQEVSPLTSELKLTLSEMLSSSTKENMQIKAIENLIDRSDVEKLREFSRGVLGVLKGEDQSSFFVLLDRDMKELAKRNVEREGRKLPKKAKKATWIVIGTFCICLLTGFIQLIVTAVNNL